MLGRRDAPPHTPPPFISTGDCVGRGGAKRRSTTHRPLPPRVVLGFVLLRCLCALLSLGTIITLASERLMNVYRLKGGRCVVAIAPRALLDTIETSHGNAFNRMQMHTRIIKCDCPTQRAPSFRAHAQAWHFVGAHFPTHGMRRMSKT
jgi:hypothetical protein